MSDIYVDFKGWRFRAPFRCINCGRMISLDQFCFARACGSCDCGRGPQSYGCFSGPRELIDKAAPYFLTEDRWSNSIEGLESHIDDKGFEEREGWQVFKTED